MLYHLHNTPKSTLVTIISLTFIIMSLTLACNQENPAPIIHGFIFEPTKIIAEDIITIQVNISRNNHEVTYNWTASEGEIVGHDKPLISYKVPSTPGKDLIILEVTYSGGTVTHREEISIEPNPNATLVATTPPTTIITEITPIPITPVPVSTTTITITPDSLTTITATQNTPPARATESVTDEPTPPTTPPPTNTPTSAPPTFTLTPTPTPNLQSPPTLISPAAGTSLSQQDNSFTWRWGGQLSEGQSFEVRIWKEGSPHFGAYDARETRTDMINNGNGSYTLSFDVAAAFGVNGNGEYLWSVAVVEINPYKDLNLESEAWPLIINVFGGNGGNGGGNNGGGGTIPTEPPPPN